MFKQLTVLLLLFGFLGQTFNRAVIVTSYYTNMAAYAKNCENKAKPVMHCNGRCQMMKKMKQEKNKDKQNPERRNDTDQVLSSKSFFASVFPCVPAKLEHNSTYCSQIPADRATGFFHPPGAEASSPV